MPRIPTLIANRQLGIQRLPVPTPQVFGSQAAEAAVESSGVFQRIQAGYDAAETAKLNGEGSAGMSGALSDAAIKFSDPEEYRVAHETGIQQAYDSTLEQATSPIVRRNLEASLANKMIEAQTHAKYGYWEKKKEMATANAIKTENDLLDKAMAAPDAASRQEYLNQYSALMGNLLANNYIKADVMQARIERFQDKAIGGAMALAAKSDPLGFSDSVAQKQWPGASLDQIQKAMDIGDKELHQREVRDQQQGKRDSDAAERKYEDQASRREMNETEMRADAHRYGWSDNKINELINIQIGLKVANPYEKKLIEDAMEPADRNAVYTMKDVREAEDNLKRLAKSGQASTLSPDYRNAMRRLQGMFDRLSNRGDVKNRQAISDNRSSEADARRDVQDIYGKYYPGPRSDGMNAEIKGHMRQLEQMTPGERRTYVDNLEKKIQRDFEKAKTPQVHTNELRGIMRQPSASPKPGE